MRTKIKVPDDTCAMCCVKFAFHHHLMVRTPNGPQLAMFCPDELPPEGEPNASVSSEENTRSSN